MRIVQIIPGFGGTFYCENCFRDGLLCRELKNLGHEVIIAPMYLPVKFNNFKESEENPIFYGAVNVYLRQMFHGFRHIPKWLEKALNSSQLLYWVSKKAGSTSSKNLGPLTVSVLKGMEGNQSEELDMLVKWIKDEVKPDLVHLSNLLLIGIAEPIFKANIPVVCSLQDEDSWIDNMTEEYAEEAWLVAAGKSAFISGFISVSNYYKNEMLFRIGMNPKDVHVIYPGIDPHFYKISDLPLNPPVIGYLSRICNSLGFDKLVDAFISIKSGKRFGDLKLKAAGGMTKADSGFINDNRRKLKKAGFSNDVEIIPDNFNVDIRSYLGSLTLLSVPAVCGTAMGTYQLEALASGVPVVQPDCGAFPEILDITGGGVLFNPKSQSDYESKVKLLLEDKKLLNKLAENGREKVIKLFNIKKTANDTASVYKKYIK